MAAANHSRLQAALQQLLHKPEGQRRLAAAADSDISDYDYGQR